jgi:hypothetical protein
MFKKLEGSKLNESDLFSFFDDNQAKLANEAFYNGDA